ncbi:MAG: hypothetical protein HY821_17645 [Acidobacteria bacterium]|nr:hypothetical protein [Acidobacteriota bacterium]
MRLFFAVCLASILSGNLAAQVALPLQTVEVKLLHQRILSLEAADKGGWVIIRDLAGRVLRKVQAGAGVDGIRAAEIKDFTLASDRTLIISLGVAFPIGRSARIMAFYPEKGEPRFLTLDDVICLNVVSDPATGVWCLGPGLEDSLLHRVSGPADGPWTLLLRRKIRVLANDGGETRQAYETGQCGVPALFIPEPGRLLAFLPNTLALHDIDLRTGVHSEIPIPVEPNGRSLLSFATRGEEIYGLLPVLPPGQTDRFTTQYTLYRSLARWTRVPSAPAWPRGTTLAGIEGGTLYLWNRLKSRLETAPLQRLKP